MVDWIGVSNEDSARVCIDVIVLYALTDMGRIGVCSIMILDWKVGRNWIACSFEHQVTTVIVVERVSRC